MKRLQSTINELHQIQFLIENTVALKVVGLKGIISAVKTSYEEAVLHLTRFHLLCLPCHNSLHKRRNCPKVKGR